MCCTVDSCEAGSGHVAAQVKGPTTHPPVMISESDGFTALSFVPLEIGEHLFFVTFDGVNISGELTDCSSAFELDATLSKSRRRLRFYFRLCGPFEITRTQK